MIELNKLVTIQTGYSLKSKMVDDPNGQIQLVQPKDIDSISNNISGTQVTEDVLGSYHNQLIQDGNIGLSNKGLNIKSVLFNMNDLERPTILSSSFFILRIQDRKIIPQYLHWYLQQETTLDRLKSMFTGSTVPTLSKKSLIQLKVPIVSLEDQMRIMLLQNQITKEKKKHLELIENGKSLVNSYGWEIINKSNL